jgi:electron transfer flavoprotein beta subunit
MTKELKMIVCIKQVPDPEAPASTIEVDSKQMQIRVRGVPPVMNPPDEAALEAALQLKEKYGGRITVLSVGENLSVPTLRKALAAGADELTLVQDPGLSDVDSLSTAFVLYKAIKRIGEYDLVLTGRQAGDWNEGQVGLILSELLKVPAINLVKKLAIEGSEITAYKVTPFGYEVVKTVIPAVLIVTHEFGELRYVPFIALQKAREKPVKIWDAKDLSIDPSNLTKRRIVILYEPSRERSCFFVEGETLEEKGKNLALLIKEIQKSESYLSLQKVG